MLKHGAACRESALRLKSGFFSSLSLPSNRVCNAEGDRETERERQKEKYREGERRRETEIRRERQKERE